MKHPWTKKFTGIPSEFVHKSRSSSVCNESIFSWHTDLNLSAKECYDTAIFFTNVSEKDLAVIDDYVHIQDEI